MIRFSVVSFALLFAAACASVAGERGPSLEFEPLPGSAAGEWSAPALVSGTTERFGDAQQLARAGRVGEAVRALRALIEDEPRAVEAHRLLQDLLLVSPGDWWVRRYYRALLERSPSDADALYLNGRIEPDPERQSELFERALSENPAHPYARIGRALTLQRAERYQDALDEARAAALSAPHVRLPWLFMASLALSRGSDDLADELFAEAGRRHIRDPRPWLGRMVVAFEDGRMGDSSSHALAALTRAPGEARTLAGAVGMLVESAVPDHLASAAKILGTARADAEDPGAVDLAIGRLQLAVGDAEAAEQALVRGEAAGLDPFETGRYLRRARILAGRYSSAVSGALSALPADVLLSDNLYAGRWAHLIECARTADARPRDGEALRAMAAALRSVGWRREATVVRARAAAEAPGDAALRAQAADARAFDRFLDALAALARDLRDVRRSGGKTPSLEVAMQRIREASLVHLGRDVTSGAEVRSYPLLGKVAASVASGGAFAAEFDDRGLLLLVGERRGDGLQVVLGRLVLVRADTAEVVLGRELTLDECWLETSGLPPDLAGFRGGLAGLTVDRLVLLQLETCLRAPEPLHPGVPFEPRPAATEADLIALDTPSAVAQRIELSLAANGRVGLDVLEAVRRHELGHVLDARRILPIGRKPLRALGLLAASGFDGGAVEQRLEGRAAVVALVEAASPRAALASLLGFLPDLQGSTAHAAGYREVVSTAVELLRDDPKSFPSVSQDQNLLQQMDRLTDAEIRELGRRLLD